VTGQVAKEVFEVMAESGRSAKEIIDERGLAAISGTDELTGIVKNVISANEKAVSDYRAGKEASLNSLLGQVMRETKGRANPQVAKDLIVSELAK
jgi:aspartyl-tRNA(Asn)/glutamyl-tRNA(Gln) amidotransferase subunit B